MKKLKTIRWRNVILFLFIMVGLLVLAQSFLVPDMVGWNVDRVKHYEAANDISIIHNNIYSDTVPYGVVANQETCDKGEDCDIILTFSKGEDVSSKPDRDIKSYLNQLKLYKYAMEKCMNRRIKECIIYSFDDSKATVMC